jgi:Pregnancy-associated plasma protein-A
MQWDCGTQDVAPSQGENTPPASESPICTDPNAIKYIRVAFHYFLSEAPITRSYVDGCVQNPPITRTYIGPGNFTETGDGNGTNYNGFQRAEDVVELANWELANNNDHARKVPGQVYPTPPPSNPTRYILTGVYFHRNTTVFNSRYIPDEPQYNKGGDSIIDVYHVWWENWYSGVSYGLGPSNKRVVTNMYDAYLKPNCTEWSLGANASNLNHEIGHALNLFHTWVGNDGCEDTPEGFEYDKVLSSSGCLPNQWANCYQFDPSIPGCPRKPCDEIHKISNNMMDYNTGPHAYTQQQINRMNANLLLYNKSVHSCNGCMPSNAFFYIPRTVAVCEGFPIYLNGEASFNEDQWLLEICETSPSDIGNCVANYYTSGWQLGQIGQVNLASFYNFSKNKSYKIKLTVNNSACPTSHEMVQGIKTVGCDNPNPPCCFEMVSNNPFNDQLFVSYSVPVPTTLSVRLVHTTTGQTYTLLSSENTLAGSHNRTFNTSSIPAGSYALQATHNSGVHAITVVKF